MSRQPLVLPKIFSNSNSSSTSDNSDKKTMKKIKKALLGPPDAASPSTQRPEPLLLNAQVVSTSGGSGPQPTYPRPKRGLPTNVFTEQPEPLLLVCAVVCRICRSLVAVLDGFHIGSETLPMGHGGDEATQTTSQTEKSTRKTTDPKHGGSQPSVVRCTKCGEHTPIRLPPEGSRYVRCVCGCLFLTKSGTKRMVCPRDSCHRFLEITNPNANQ